MSLTPKDVAADLHLTVPTILARFKDGTLPGYRVGGRWRIEPSDLAAWKAGPARPADPNRIEPRGNRGTALLGKKKVA
jgi:excisionase family DNA binding protein